MIKIAQFVWNAPNQNERSSWEEYKIPSFKQRWGFLLIKTGRIFIDLKTGRKGGPVLKRFAIWAMAIGMVVMLADLSYLWAAERGLKSVTVETTQGERIELRNGDQILICA